MSATTLESRRYRWTMAGRGARYGAIATSLYAAVFLLYAVVRTFVELLDGPMPGPSLLLTFIASAGGMILAGLVFAVAASAVSMTAGGATMYLIAWATELIHPRARLGEVLIGAVITSIAAVLLNVLTLRLLANHSIELPWQTYLFWMALPSLAYVAATARAVGNSPTTTGGSDATHGTYLGQSGGGSLPPRHA